MHLIPSPGVCKETSSQKKADEVGCLGRIKIGIFNHEGMEDSPSFFIAIEDSVFKANARDLFSGSFCDPVHRFFS